MSTKINSKSYKQNIYFPFWSIFLSLAFLISSCTYPGGRGKVPQLRLTIENPLPIKRTDVPVVLKLNELKKVADNFSLNMFRVTAADNQDIPSQADDLDNDGIRDELVFLVDLEPQQTREIIIMYTPQQDKTAKPGSPGYQNMTITVDYPKRVQAGLFPELRGIAWESELIMYRLPFNERTSVDVFCKEAKGLSFAQLISDIPTGRQTSMPTQPIGNWSGCGGFGLWDGKAVMSVDSQTYLYPRVIANGPIRTVVQLIFDNWKFRSDALKVTSTFSIFGGQQWSKHHLKIEGNSAPIQIATGLPQRENINLIQDEKEGVIYTWGKQSNWSQSDELGLSIIYPTKYFASYKGNTFTKGIENQIPSHAVILNPDEKGQLQYYFMADWNRSEDGAKAEQDFANRVKFTAAEINTPPIVKILPRASAK
ncbi:DUF4861 family protein [bacterium]|nr:DUF4861 family protein [bacterium]